MTQSTCTSSRLAKASQLGKNLSTVPTVPTLKDVVGGAPSAPKEPEEGLLSTVEGGAKVVVPVVVQGPAVVSNNAPMVAFVPKEPENGLLLNAVPTPSSVAVSKGNVESSSLSDDDSSDSGSEESGSGGDGSDSSSTTSSSDSHTEKPVKPSFPTGVGTVIVSTAELVAAVSAASVAIATVLGPELPSASLFEGPPEETLPETYGPGEPEEADNEATDEGVMDVTNAIFEEDMMMVMKSRKTLMALKKKMRRKLLMAVKKKNKSRKVVMALKKRRKLIMVKKKMSRQLLAWKQKKSSQALKSRMQPW
jgi:hypothetical protein